MYPPGPVRIETATAKAQIRGTGVYVESDPELTYFCTCFGVTEVVAKDDPDSTDVRQLRPITTGRSTSLAGAQESRQQHRTCDVHQIHTDEELKLIETLVGRTLPPNFVFPDPRYQTPKGGTYRP